MEEGGKKTIREYLYKVIIIGNAGAGKTSFVNRYTRNEFKEDTKYTSGVEFAIKSIPIDSDIIKVQIWDTAGQDRFRAITPQYYRGTSAVIVVYDITDRLSFKAVPDWLKELSRYISPTTLVVLIGNKSDLESRREVTIEEANQFAADNNLFWLEASAKSAINVVECFQHVFQEMHSSHGNLGTRLDSVSLSDTATPPLTTAPPPAGNVLPTNTGPQKKNRFFSFCNT